MIKTVIWICAILLSSIVRATTTPTPSQLEKNTSQLFHQIKNMPHMFCQLTKQLAQTHTTNASLPPMPTADVLLYLKHISLSHTTTLQKINHLHEIFHILHHAIYPFSFNLFHAILEEYPEPPSGKDISNYVYYAFKLCYATQRLQTYRNIYIPITSIHSSIEKLAEKEPLPLNLEASYQRVLDQLASHTAKDLLLNHNIPAELWLNKINTTSTKHPDHLCIQPQSPLLKENLCLKKLTPTQVFLVMIHHPDHTCSLLNSLTDIVHDNKRLIQAQYPQLCAHGKPASPEMLNTLFSIDAFQTIAITWALLHLSANTAFAEKLQATPMQSISSLEAQHKIRIAFLESVRDSSQTPRSGTLLVNQKTITLSTSLHKFLNHMTRKSFNDLITQISPQCPQPISPHPNASLCAQINKTTTASFQSKNWKMITENIFSGFFPLVPLKGAIVDSVIKALSRPNECEEIIQALKQQMFGGPALETHHCLHLLLHTTLEQGEEIEAKDSGLQTLSDLHLIKHSHVPLCAPVMYESVAQHYRITPNSTMFLVYARKIVQIVFAINFWSMHTPENLANKTFPEILKHINECRHADPNADLTIQKLLDFLTALSHSICTQGALMNRPINYAVAPVILKSGLHLPESCKTLSHLSDTSHDPLSDMSENDGCAQDQNILLPLAEESNSDPDSFCSPTNLKSLNTPTLGIDGNSLESSTSNFNNSDAPIHPAPPAYANHMTSPPEQNALSDNLRTPHTTLLAWKLSLLLLRFPEVPCHTLQSLSTISNTDQPLSLEATPLSQKTLESLALSPHIAPSVVLFLYLHQIEHPVFFNLIQTYITRVATKTPLHQKVLALTEAAEAAYIGSYLYAHHPQIFDDFIKNHEHTEVSDLKKDYTPYITSTLQHLLQDSSNTKNILNTIQTFQPHTSESCESIGSSNHLHILLGTLADESLERAFSKTLCANTLAHFPLKTFILNTITATLLQPDSCSIEVSLLAETLTGSTSPTPAQDTIAIYNKFKHDDMFSEELKTYLACLTELTLFLQINTASVSCDQFFHLQHELASYTPKMPQSVFLHQCLQIFYFLLWCDSNAPILQSHHHKAICSDNPQSAFKAIFENTRTHITNQAPFMSQLLKAALKLSQTYNIPILTETLSSPIDFMYTYPLLSALPAPEALSLLNDPHTVLEQMEH